MSKNDEAPATEPTWKQIELTSAVPIKVSGSDTPRNTFDLTMALSQGWHSVTTLTTNRFTTNQWAWIATFFVTVVAAFIRLFRLGNFSNLVFDETYYIKDAYTLLNLGYESQWPDDVNEQFAAGDFSSMTNRGSFVVHPQVGKWLIAAGMRVCGTGPWGWRISAAIFGIITVYLVARIAWNLFDSAFLTAIAGSFAATDGMNIVLSRTGLLDVFLTTFILAAFLAVIKDQQSSRALLASRLRIWRPDSTQSWWEKLGPSAGHRWWLLLAGILLGLACGVKWSGLFAVAVLGTFVVIREFSARLAAGMPLRVLLGGTVLKDGLHCFFVLVPTAVLVYLLSWWSWIINPQAWGHTAKPEAGSSMLSPAALLHSLQDLWRYHQQVFRFHESVTTEHTYEANPWQWFLNLRPTSFAFENTTVNGHDQVEVLTAFGNPLLWWIGVAAIVFLIGASVYSKDWRGGLIICGYLATWAPWLMYPDRTIFMFYAVAMAPFVTLAVTWAIGIMLGEYVSGTEPLIAREYQLASPRDYSPISLQTCGAILVVLIIVAAIFMMPIWTGTPITKFEWQLRMWLPSWI